MDATTAPRTGAVNTAAPFEEFWQRERQSLYGAVALALGDPALAAEAVDEAMVRAYQRWSRVSRYERPAGWVYRVALNWGRSSLRRRRRAVAGGGPEPSVAPPQPRDDALWRAVALLPPDQRDVIALRYQLDWPITWIAGALDIPVGTAKSRLHRGLDRLRDALEGAA